jgi:hypothetical protein
VARSDPHVENAQMFGDRLHLRVHPGSAEVVMEALRGTIPTRGGLLSQIRAITPQLEDVFIDLLEGQSAEQTSGEGA